MYGFFWKKIGDKNMQRNISFEFNEQTLERLKEYLKFIQNSSKSKDLNLTDYWIYHSNKIDIKFNKKMVTLFGDSGFYFPPKRNWINQLRNFARNFPTQISYQIFKAYKNILPSLTIPIYTYPIAYEYIWKHDQYGNNLLDKETHSQRLCLQNLENKVLNFRTIKGMNEKRRKPKTLMLCDQTIRSYFNLQILEGSIKNLKSATVCEIGSGTGNLASMLYHHFKTKLFLIDLPKTFFFSFCYLSKNFPDIKILLPNEVENGNLEMDSYDVVMLTPNQTSIIPDKSVDLTINIASMQEMKKKNINAYFDMMDRTNKPNGYFFTINRVEKVMDEELNRLSEYPWRTNTRTVFYELHPLLKLTQLDPCFIRIEQYLQNI
jgi:putative sugar O-methyltransferase